MPPSGWRRWRGSSSPDLIVESPSVSDTTPNDRKSFTLSATVRNQGTGSSASTTLRYYRSSDATISASDTEVGTDAVGSLNASGTSAESISLNAPSSAGTYYYGACVENVSGESIHDTTAQPVFKDMFTRAALTTATQDLVRPVFLWAVRAQDRSKQVVMPITSVCRSLDRVR